MVISSRHFLEFLPSGPPPPPSQTITLPRIADTDTILAPVVMPERVIVLPLLNEGDAVLAPVVTLLPLGLNIVLPRIADTDTILAPILRPEAVILLPLLVDGDTILAPVVIAPQFITLPKVTDGDTILAPIVSIGGPLIVLPRIVDGDTILAPRLFGVPQAIVLPLLDDADVVLPPFLRGGNIAALITLLHRYFGSGATEGEPGYWPGQTIELVGVFMGPNGHPINPGSVTVELISPAGVIQTWSFGPDPEVEQLNVGEFRLVVAETEHGEWAFRYQGVLSESSPAAEATFHIRKSHFE